MSEVKLEPCPFCGGEGNIQGDDGKFFSHCMGHDCFCSVGERYDPDGWPDHIFTDPESAAEAWNRRAPHPAHAAVEAMAQALKEMIDECYSELDMMSCEYTRGSAEALAWESGVRQAWKLWDLSKQPGVAALAACRATQNKEKSK